MRYYFVVVLTFIFFNNTSAQVSGGNAFQSQNINTGYMVSGSDVVLPSYNSNGEAEGNPYFSKDWIKGFVKTISNEEFSNGLLFMYDKISGKLYFKNQDSAIIMEADKSKIYSFSLITDKVHLFMRGDLFSRDYTGKFFEVLVFNDKKYSFLKYTTTNFEPSVTSKASQAMTQSLSNGKYVDKTNYFLYYNDVLQPVELKKKTFLKALDNTAYDTAEFYIKNNNSNFNELYVTRLLEAINK